MIKWKCEICNKEFENFYAHGFNHKIYCPLCYFKEENRQLQQENQELKDNWNKLKEYISYNVDNGLLSREDEWAYEEILDKTKEIEGDK